MTAPVAADHYLLHTQRWVERVVIGLNLCPFAHAVAQRGQIRYVLSMAQSEAALIGALIAELDHLMDADPAQIDTTLLVHPLVLTDFLDFNDFMERADAVLSGLDLEGVIQIAHFHPDFCFADANQDDPANGTNRAPYPTLHLLREASVDRAIERIPDPAQIYERNIRTLRALTADERLALFHYDGSGGDTAR